MLFEFPMFSGPFLEFPGFTIRPDGSTNEPRPCHQRILSLRATRRLGSHDSLRKGGDLFENLGKPWENLQIGSSQPSNIPNSQQNRNRNRELGNRRPSADLNPRTQVGRGAPVYATLPFKPTKNPLAFAVKEKWK